MAEQIAPGSRDEAFRIQMNAGPGWMDLELLLRTLAKVGDLFFVQRHESGLG